MEETKETPSKLTYEQLEQTAKKLNQRLMMAEGKLRTIDFASMRLTWLFKVIENKDSFSEFFINKCASEIETLLTIDEDDKQEEEVN